MRGELDQLAKITLVHGVRHTLAAPFQHDLAFRLPPAFLEAVRWLPEYDFRFDIGISDDNLPSKETHFHRADDDPTPASVGFQFDRFPNVTTSQYASDHCPIFFTTP